jgi:uncharacterized SAM-binding protein YcdF (DUF218 family)
MHPKLLRRIAYVAAALVVILACLLKWGSRLLVAPDALPPHADSAVVLQGSIAGEKARLAGAMELLRRGNANEVLLSIPQKGFWDQDIRPLALDYLKARYGNELTVRVAFCETPPQVDSTESEAEVLVECIHQHGWRNITVVTSDYHTRRAGIIWRRVIGKQDPKIHFWVNGVSDPEFYAKRWWAQRTSAKTWLLESMKLITTLL